MIFVNKSKKLGRDLAELSISLCGDNEVLSFARNNAFNEIETMRFVFGFSIVNIALSIFAVNLLLRSDESKAKSILDPMLNHYFKRMSKSPEQIRIGDFIVDDSELHMLKSVFEVLPDTHINYFTLLDMVYEQRASQYFQDLSEGFAKFSDNKTGSLGPTFSIASSFSDHLHGTKETKNKMPRVIGLSLLIYSLFKVIVEYCKDHKPR